MPSNCSNPPKVCTAKGVAIATGSSDSCTELHAPNARPRRRKPQPPAAIDWAPAYLAALERSGQKAASATAAGIDISTVRHRRQRDSEFVRREQEAVECAKELVESEIFRRAVEGVPRIYFGRDGKKTSETREYSDTLILRLAEKLETGSFRQKQQIEHGTPGAFATRAERLAKMREIEAEIAATGGKPMAGYG